MIIGFAHAESKSEEGNLSDIGWKFDPATIREMQPAKKVITVYEDVKD